MRRRHHDLFGLFFCGIFEVVRRGQRGELKDLGDVVSTFGGGALGGLFGSRAPDLLEPAHHPHHRSTFHSVVATTAVVVKGGQLIRTLHPEQRPDESRGARWLRLFAGSMLDSLPMGYATHIAADATTARSVPLLTRGL